MDDQVLARIDKARSYLAEAKSLIEVKHVRDLAIAAEVYAKQAGSSRDVSDYAAEIRWRAERKLGEVLEITPMNEGGYGPGRGKKGGTQKEPAFNLPTTLAENGIPKKLSARAKQLAKVPIEEFETLVTAVPDRETGPTSRIKSVLQRFKLMRARKIVEEQAREQALAATITHSDWDSWLWALENQYDLLLTDPPYSTDVENIAEFAEDWLPSALGLIKPTGRAYVCIGAYPNELAAYLNVKLPEHIQLVQVLVWTYKNTLGPKPTLDYKQNWQAILYFRGVTAPALNCPLMSEQFSVMEINAPDGRIGDRYHKWQKPDELGERLVRHSTQEGASVIDPFAGTGTFLLAGAKLGRRTFGCDVDRAQVDLAIQRGCHEG
jgi:DNA modification methylase